ncbi:MAG: CBS domain-containing protein [Azospirillum sp.]|nr:CBS domain-containing protein [Azospirillum sp.]
MTFQLKMFRLLAQDHMRAQPPVLRYGTPCQEAVATMARAGASCALVISAAGRINGILTERDVARRIAFQVAPETPVERVMSGPISTVNATDYLYRAVSMMRRLGIRHMPVVDRPGKVVGVLDLHDAIAALAGFLMDQIDRLAVEGTIEGLRSVKAAQVQLAAEMFHQDVAAPEIQQLLTDINMDIYRRIVEANLAAMAEQDWGRPPVDFSVLLMGSGGRGENFLYPDQDNGFVLEEYPDENHTAIDSFFIQLAERMTRDLNAIGFPYCHGNVMATNPLWRKTLPQWRRQITYWTLRRNFFAARLVAIFLDFRSAYGRQDLVEELRVHVTATLSHAPGLLNELYQSEAEHGTALGWFNWVKVESGRGEHNGAVNLKLNGLLPLVEGVRLLALRAGIPETRTLTRLDRLAEAGVVTRDEVEYLESAFVHLTGLLMRQQIADFQAGHRVGNHLDPYRLSKRDYEQLVDSFQSIETLRSRIRQEFTADVF